MDKEALSQYVITLSKVQASCLVLVRQLDNLSDEFQSQDRERMELLTGVAAMLKDLAEKIRVTYVGLSDVVG